MGHSVKQRAERITANTTLNETIYYSWFAQNVGSAPVSVYGIELLPGEGLNSQAIAHTTPEDLWTQPIEITVQPGGAVQMLRAQAMPIGKSAISGKPVIGGRKR